MSDTDYENLPLDQLLEHSLWKARQLGYNKVKDLAQDSNNSNETIQDLINAPIKLQKLVADTNVAAQESGIGALLSILQNSKPAIFDKTKDSIISILVEKGLTSSRANTKTGATEIILLFVEMGHSKEVIEVMVPSLNAKSPKQVSSTIKGINEIYSAFGCPAIDPKLIMSYIPKMFEHSDRNVRSEASNLSVTLRTYIGEAFDSVIFPKIKPIQQKDLKALFNKIPTDVKPTRILYSQKVLEQQQQQQQKQKASDDDDDIQMTEEVAVGTTQEFDPYEFEDPVDVLSKLPTDLSDRLTNSSWKERVEVLEEITPYFNILKAQNDDYSYFISLMVGCLKDVNLQVVTLSCGILFNLANALKTSFSKYVSSVVPPLLERTKERKKPVLVAINNVLDACFKYSSLHEVVDPTVEFMVHISPQVKAESLQYMVRCLKEIQQLPSGEDIDKIMTTTTKLLQDSQVMVRNAASEVIGTLMKIIGPEKSKNYMEKVDKRHVKKIQQISKTAAVKFEAVKKPLANEAVIIVEQNSSLNDNVPNLRQMGSISSPFEDRELKDSEPFNKSVSSIPSKRAATSPLKENIVNHKNTLTSKSLKASGMSNYGISAQQLQELENLKREKMEWMEAKKELLSQLEEVKNNNDSLLKNVVTLNGKLDDYHNKFTTLSMTLKSKDTQIFRLKSDLENNQIKYSQLQQKNKLLKSQLELTNANTNAESSQGNDPNDISRRVSILSIDSDEGNKANDNVLKLPDASIYNFDEADDGWKRATAVTNDLKAKIQRMKARSRLLDSVDD